MVETRLWNWNVNCFVVFSYTSSPVRNWNLKYHLTWWQCQRVISVDISSVSFAVRTSTTFWWTRNWIIIYFGVHRFQLPTLWRVSLDKYKNHPDCERNTISFTATRWVPRAMERNFESWRFSVLCSKIWDDGLESPLTDELG